MKEVLKLKNVSKKYQAKNGEVEALSNISFEVKQGEFVSIIGPSGCRKINPLVNRCRARTKNIRRNSN